MENLNNLLSEIDEKLEAKEITPLIKNLLRKFNLQSEKALGDLLNLCSWLYIYDAKEYCIVLIKYVPCEFNDSYLNSWFRPIHALNSRLLREKGEESEAELLMEKH